MLWLWAGALFTIMPPAPWSHLDATLQPISAAAPDTSRPHTPWHRESHARMARMMTGRFFGLGPTTREEGASGYSRAHAAVGLDHSYRLALESTPRRRTQFGLGLQASYDVLFGAGASRLPATRALYPRAPALRRPVWQTVVRAHYRRDTREGGPWARRGTLVHAEVAVHHSLAGATSFVSVHVDARRLFTQSFWAHTVARVDTRWVSSARTPFYQQSALGGGHLLRGHLESRFVDRGAWTAEVEQRLRVGSTRMGQHRVGWHIDPFVAVGQVYGLRAPWQAPLQLTYGVGLRAVSAPHFVARLDLGIAAHRPRGVLALGYPF